MITKSMFCEHIIREFCKSNNIKRKHISEDLITQSSKLAVAMEYLGLIKTPDLQEYAKSRAGILVTLMPDNPGEIHMLTVREMLDLLPETIELTGDGNES